MKDFVNLSQKMQIPLIEDCAQAHGTQFEGQRVGSIGKAGCFSFFATKHITTCGEGGIIVTDDTRIADTARMIRSHGMMDRDRHVLLGYNNRMSEIVANRGPCPVKKNRQAEQQKDR
jgi:perosamine synthetase